MNTNIVTPQSGYTKCSCGSYGEPHLHHPRTNRCPELPQSGNTPCACRDCMDITVSNDTTKPELCGNCIDADCLAYSEADEREGVPSYSYECQRDDAYGEC